MKIAVLTKKKNCYKKKQILSFLKTPLAEFEIKKLQLLSGILPFRAPEFIKIIIYSTNYPLTRIIHVAMSLPYIVHCRLICQLFMLFIETNGQIRRGLKNLICQMF